MTEIIQDNSISDFLEQAGSLLYKEEASNSLMLGLCESMLKDNPKNPPLLFRIVENEKTVSAAIQTPPMNLVITFSTQAQLEKLADVLREKGAEIPGVVGPARESEVFAKIWASLTGKEAKLGMGQKIYRLKKVIAPKKIDGKLHVAGQADAETVLRWAMAFCVESLPNPGPRTEEHWRAFADGAIKKGAAHLWCVDETPVSMAFVSRPTKNGISINGVYTPVENRKNGYASAVVAHLSQKMLDLGRDFCVLYTDLENPTSNRIYQNIGYQEVSDSKLFLFL